MSGKTDETRTQAIIRAMRERLERPQREQQMRGDYVARMRAFVSERGERYDRLPVTSEEWDEACGDTSERPRLR